jgi:hypothetical protein
MIKSPKKTIITSLIIVKLLIILYLIMPGLKGFGDTLPDEPVPELPSSNKTYRLPDEVSFAGERVPLEYFDTRESLEREILTSAYRHSSTILIIKRANRYFPVIEKILEKNGVPDDLKYLVAAESEFSNAVSPRGAAGFWQIMPATGKEAGMEITTIIDERYHLEKSTQFACDYLLRSYERYGSWALAAASYNGGRAAIDEQVKIQKENNYYDLLLTEETARYVFRAIAYKLVISDPARYGFEIREDELYLPLNFTEVRVTAAIDDFADFAKKNGTNYKLLKFFNPWLRRPSFVPRPGKEYMIKIPVEGERMTGQRVVDF